MVKKQSSTTMGIEKAVAGSHTESMNCGDQSNDVILDRSAVITVEAIENLRSVENVRSLWVRAEFAGEALAIGEPVALDERGYAPTRLEAMLRWSSSNPQAIDSLLAHPILLTVMGGEQEVAGKDSTSDNGEDDRSRAAPQPKGRRGAGTQSVEGVSSKNNRVGGTKSRAKTKSKPAIDPLNAGIIVGRATFDLLPLLLGEPLVEEELSLEAERPTIPMPEQLAWTDLPRVCVRAMLHRVERLEAPLGSTQSSVDAQPSPSQSGSTKRGPSNSTVTQGTPPNFISPADMKAVESVVKVAGPELGSKVAAVKAGQRAAEIQQRAEDQRISQDIPRLSEKSEQPGPWAAADAQAEDDEHGNGDIGDGNVLFVTVESLFAPPRQLESPLAGDNASSSLGVVAMHPMPLDESTTPFFSAFTALPVGMEKFQPVTFEGGITMDGPEFERAPRWSTLYNLRTRAALTKYRMCDELSDVKCTLHDASGNLIGPAASLAAAFAAGLGPPGTTSTSRYGSTSGSKSMSKEQSTSSAEQAVEAAVSTLLQHQGHRVQWNSLRRCYLTDVVCNSIYALIAKYHLWPFEVTLTAPGSTSPSSSGTSELRWPIYEGGCVSRLAPGVVLGPIHQSISKDAPSKSVGADKRKRAGKDASDTASAAGNRTPSTGSSRQGSRSQRQTSLQQQQSRNKWVAYVDLSHLLYPGVTRTRVAAPVMPMDPTEVERLCGPRGGGLSKWPSTDEAHAGASAAHGPTLPGGVSAVTDDPAAGKMLPVTTVSNVGIVSTGRATLGSKGRSQSMDRPKAGSVTPESSSVRARGTILSSLAEKATEVEDGDEVEGSRGEPTLVVEVQLMRPLVPKRPVEDLEQGIRTEVPTRAVLPKSVVAAMEAENDYRSTIEEMVEVIGNQFRDYESLRHQMDPGGDVLRGETGGGCGQQSAGKLVVEQQTPTQPVHPPRLRDSIKGPAAVKLAFLRSSGAAEEEVAMAEMAAEVERTREVAARQQAQRARADERARESTRMLRAQGHMPPTSEVLRWFTESGFEAMAKQAQDERVLSGAGDADQPCCGSKPPAVTCDDEASAGVFIEFMRARGVYSLLRERLRGPLASIVREKFSEHLHQDQPLDFKRVAEHREEATARVRTQNFLSDAFVFAVAEAHGVLNSILDRGEKVPKAAVRESHPASRLPTAVKSYTQWPGGKGPRGQRRRRTLFAEEALEDDNPNRAAQLLIQPVREAPLEPDGWLYYGVLLLRLQERGRAIECFREALALGPRHRLALVIYGITLCEMGRHIAAELFLDAATNFYPQFVEAWVALHLYYVRMDRTAAAEVAYGLARKSYESSLQHAEWFWRDRSHPLAWRPRHAWLMPPGALTPPSSPMPAANLRHPPFAVYTATGSSSATIGAGSSGTLTPAGHGNGLGTATSGGPPPVPLLPPSSRASLDEKVAVLMPLPESVAVAATNRPMGRITAAAAAGAAQEAADALAALEGGGVGDEYSRGGSLQYSVHQSGQHSMRGSTVGPHGSTTVHGNTHGAGSTNGNRRTGRTVAPHQAPSGMSQRTSGAAGATGGAPVRIEVTTDDLPSVFLIAAPMFIALGLYEFAELALARELETQGPSEIYHYYVAALHYARGHYEEGIPHIEQAIGESPKEPLLWALLGHLRMRSGQSEAAEPALELAHETKCTAGPDHAHLARIRLAAQKTNTGRLIEARNILREAVTNMPTPLSWRWLGITSFKLHNLKEAEEAFYESNMLDNTCPTTWGYLALINLIRGEERKFQQCYRMALKHNLNDAQLLHEIKMMQKLQNFPDIEGIVTEDLETTTNRVEGSTYVDEVLSKATVKTHRKDFCLSSGRDSK